MVGGRGVAFVVRVCARIRIEVWVWTPAWRVRGVCVCFYVFVAVVRRGRIIPVLLFVLVVLARRGFSV